MSAVIANIPKVLINIDPSKYVPEENTEPQETTDSTEAKVIFYLRFWVIRCSLIFCIRLRCGDTNRR